jgi:hypothetical protein
VSDGWIIHGYDKTSHALLRNQVYKKQHLA